MNTNRVDGIIENVLFPGEGGGQDLPKSHPRFKWTPPGAKPTGANPPLSQPGAVPPQPKVHKGGVPPTPHEADWDEGEGAGTAPAYSEELPDDREGNLSINQLLGGGRFANKNDLDAAVMRMRGKLGPGGAEKWGHEYGQMEFEALAREIVDALLECDKAEKEVNKFVKDTKKVVKDTHKTVSKWMRGLGRAKPVKESVCCKCGNEVGDECFPVDNTVGQGKSGEMICGKCYVSDTSHLTPWHKQGTYSAGTRPPWNRKMPPEG